MAVQNGVRTQSRPVRKSTWKRRFKIFGLLSFIALVIGFSAGYFVWLKALTAAAKEVPKLEKFRAMIATAPTEIVSADGKVLYSFINERREPIKISDVPQLVIDTTLAAEDRRFYEHDGVDEIAVLRQVVTNARERRIEGGASTLTMQLAKRLFTGSQQTISRKLQDAALAIQIERKYTKDEILELYLNQVFYGQRAYGIQTAARTYFDKPLDKLTIAEAALLARCVRRPSDENPVANLDKAVANRNVVLKVLLTDKKISKSEYEQAIAEPVKLSRRPMARSTSEKAAPYFVDYVLDRLDHEMPGVDFSLGGYRIETTLDFRMQEIAEQEVRKLVRRYRRSGVTTGAFILTNRQGHVVAMVGGVDYERNEFNMIYQGRRQPGSSMKPFVYAMALERGEVGPYDSISNEAINWYDRPSRKWWRPKNSDGTVGGSLPIRTCLIFSKNLPSIRIMEKLGPTKFVGDARNVFGFETPLEPNLSLVLGTTAVSPMELARAYSVFMTKGDLLPVYGIKRVFGPEGTVVRNFTLTPRIGVLSAPTAETVDGWLRDVVTSGTATRASSVTNAHGKTGTTQDNRDAWFAGYTQQFLGIGWIASEVPNPDKNSRLKWIYNEMSSSVFGGTVTVQMWTRIMNRCQEIYREEDAKLGSDKWSDPEEEVEDRPRRRRTNDEPEPDPQEPEPQEPSVESPGPDEQREPPRRNREPEPNPKPREDPPPVNNTPPADPAPPRNDRGRRSTVTVMVCPDSGRLAKDSCPEQMPRTYISGEEPKRYCTKDHSRG